MRLVLGLLGQVRDRLDAGVGDHADGIASRKCDHVGATPRSTLPHERRRREHEDDAEQDEQQLRHEVDDGERDVQARGLLRAEDVDGAEDRDDDRADDDVRRRGAQRLPEQPADVVRHEERRDRDRDDVVEHLRPGREERHELVERVAREARRAARLRDTSPSPRRTSRRCRRRTRPVMRKTTGVSPSA